MSSRSSFSNIRAWVYIVISLVLVTLGAFLFRFSTQSGKGSPQNLQFNTAQIGLERQLPIVPGVSGFDVTKIVDQVGASVALINTKTEQMLFDYYRQPYLSRNEGVGSGVVIEPNGYILTNNHVVANATSIEVTLPGRAPVGAELIGADPQTDLAVIRIKAANLSAVQIGDSQNLKVGQPVVAIGNPFGFDNTVTTGVISALNRSLPLEQGVWLEGLIQTDASINPGNSGGPLLNALGQVIGVNTAIIQQAQGIGFAIPIHLATAVVQNLVSHGKVLRLGVFAETLSPEVAQRIQQAVGVDLSKQDNGVVVLGVQNGTAAVKAGLRPGDVIREINGQKVSTREELMAIVQQLKYRERIRLVIYRGQRKLQLDTRLE